MEAPRVECETMFDMPITGMNGDRRRDLRKKSVVVWPREKSVGTISIHMGFESRRKTEM